MPPFSPVLSALLNSLADETMSFAELAALMERDTVISGHVLRLVNSALYGRRGTVSSVRGAVAILGVNKLRNFLLGMSVSRIWARVRTPESWKMERFNAHSTAVAVLSDLIVQKGRYEYPEGAFAAGLLHDLGRLMLATALPEQYEEVARLHKAGEGEWEEIERRCLQTTHAELSAAALARWGLPAPIRQAVLYHHRPEDQPRTDGRAAPLSEAVWLADDVARVMGHRLNERTGEEEAGSPRARELAEALAADFEREFGEMHSNL